MTLFYQININQSITISADCMFFFLFLFNLFCHKALNGGFAIEEFFLIYRDFACTKGSDDLPDFLKEKLFFLWIMRMFSKLSEMTILIPFLFYMYV